MTRSKGEEGIELRDGSRITFKARSAATGLGFTADLLVFDEAMWLPEWVVAALLPTLSARPRPQAWYTGSAVDQTVHEHGTVLARIRERGRSVEGDPDLLFLETDCGVDLATLLEHPEMMDDERLWELSNPALDVRISREHIAKERASLSPRSFAVMR